MSDQLLNGRLLVASPELHDPNFRQSVVLLVQHGGEGALGLILNRPTSLNLDEAWEKVKETRCRRTDRLFWGGPCQGPLMALHTDPARSDIDVIAGVHFSGQPEHIESLVDDAEATVRFFVGYAGWSGGQLEDELKAGGWLLADVEADDVFHHEDDLWRRVVVRIKREAWLGMLGIDDAPGNVGMN